MNIIIYNKPNCCTKAINKIMPRLNGELKENKTKNKLSKLHSPPLKDA